MARPKRVNYELVEPPHSVYDLLFKVVGSCHGELGECRIAILWRKCLKPDPDGKIVLGKIGKVSDDTREMAPYDLKIALNDEAWAAFDEDQREGYLDHLLQRVTVSKDRKTGEVKRDERGRVLLRGRKPDVVEYSAVIDRRGLYLADLKDFAEKCALKSRAPLFADIPDEPAPNGEADPAATGRSARPKRSRRKADVV